MSQIKKKFLAPNSVDESKIKLSNNASLKARNAADNADLNLIKANASDKAQIDLELDMNGQAISNVGNVDGVDVSQLKSDYDAHVNGGANKHDASEIDYERLDASKKNIDAASDTAESALSDLDDAIGSLDATPSNYTPADPAIVADHLAAIDSALAGVAGADKYVKVSSNDTTAGYVEDKFVVDNGSNSSNPLEASTLNDGGNEDYRIRFDQSKVDHGSIAGLGDDDHTQYILVNGSRAFSAAQSMGGFKLTNLANGTASGDAVNKSQLDALSSIIENFEWQPSALDYIIDNTLAPPTEVSGDRYLLSHDGGTPHTDYDGADAGDIVEFNGSVWVETNPTVGMMISIDDETTSLRQYSGSAWGQKYFESTTASTGLVKVGFDVRLDSSSAGAGLGFSAGVLSVNVDDSTIEINTDTLRVKDAGITLAKLASDSVDENKVVSTSFDAAGALSGGSGTKFKVNDGIGIDLSSNNINQLADYSSANLGTTAIAAADGLRGKDNADASKFIAGYQDLTALSASMGVNSLYVSNDIDAKGTWIGTKTLLAGNTTTKSGDIRVASGQIRDSGNSLATGNVNVTTGDQVSGGGTGTSGNTTIQSGLILGGSSASGTAILRSGANAGSGASGAVTVNSGNNTGSGNSGAVNLQSGSSSAGNSGAVNILSGTAGGTRGAVNITGNGITLDSDAGDISVASNKIVNLANGSSANDAVNFSQLDAKLDKSLTDSYIFVGNASNVATGVAVSGDMTISNTGDMQIATGAIVNADVNAAAAIAYSKLNLSSSIVNADIAAGAAIVDTKLATISTANKVSGSAVQLNASGALEDSTGLKVRVDNSTAKINGSNNLEVLKAHSQKITLSGTDITNQYVDLSFAAYSAASISLVPVGGIDQEQAVDYTVSLTGGAGGVTRISFIGDLATGGAAELVAAEKIVVKYSYLT
jgi:hypothetical protein